MWTPLKFPKLNLGNLTKEKIKVVLRTLHKMIIRTFIVNEEIANFFVPKVMNNSVPFLSFLVAEVFIENCFHLFFIRIVEKHKLGTIFPNLFRDGVKVLGD